MSLTFMQLRFSRPNHMVIRSWCKSQIKIMNLRLCKFWIYFVVPVTRLHRVGFIILILLIFNTWLASAAASRVMMWQQTCTLQTKFQVVPGVKIDKEKFFVVVTIVESPETGLAI